MLFSWVLMMALSNVAYRIHTKWLPMPRETFNVVIYSYFGVYKILIIVLNLVPFIALSIVD